LNFGGLVETGTECVQPLDVITMLVLKVDITIPEQYRFKMDGNIPSVLLEFILVQVLNAMLVMVVHLM
jgi:hypothetical protein